MFVPVLGGESKPNFKDTTLIVPCHSVGMSAFIALDLYILNDGFTKVGYFDSRNLTPGISNDGLSLKRDEGNIILPCEIYHSATQKVTLFMLITGVGSGRTRKFCDELVKFYKEGQFSNIVILTSTTSPINRDRDSNRK